MEKHLYKCSCGYVTHFEKALKAHCSFRHHKPLAEDTIVPDVQEELEKALTAEPVVVKKTRKPRVKKSAEKEQK